MKIGIEAQRIFRKKKHGMDIVALELIRHLQKIDTENQYVIFVKSDEDHTVIEESKNVKIVTIKGGPYPYWEQVLLPKAVKEHGVEILHCTSNTAPLNLSVPLIVTVHDIIYLEKWNFSKGSLYQIVGNLYRRWNVPPVVKKSSLIITVSDFERKRIKEHFNLNDDQVKTVYNGVGDHFKRVNDAQTLALVKQKYGLPDNYVFYLGNTDPKKNITGVMRSLSLLRKQNRLNFQLLMLDIDREFLHRIADQIGDPEILSYISFCGYVPNNELPAIYSMARLFLYPSLRESFGIPILEAMACGVPVVTSDTSSMPEVAGNAALFANPNNPEEIGEKVMLLLEKPELANDLILKGLMRSRQFSWENNAIDTLNLYRELLSKQKLLNRKA
jgi:glycosyltransferase involved in cell wall biosynthesis